MAGERRSYPMLQANAWWKLREQFGKSIPGSVTSNYLATVLDVGEKTAANIIPPLRSMGLLDDENKPTERANRWRFDEDYAAVCKEILQDVYPDELTHAVPDPVEDRDGALRWFKRDASVGDAAARRMAQAYALIFDADPAKKPDSAATSATRRVNKSKPPEGKTEKAAAGHGAAEPGSKKKDPTPRPPMTPAGFAPAVHIDVQIHISSDTSMEQIDQIFASMRKHLYEGNK